jgi:hypothetical protein
MEVEKARRLRYQDDRATRWPHGEGVETSAQLRRRKWPTGAQYPCCRRSSGVPRCYCSIAPTSWAPPSTRTISMGRALAE